jgi:hypothetical protein
MIQQLHARLFAIEGRQVLAYLDQEDDAEGLIIRFRVWGDAPIGPVEYSITLSGSISDDGVRNWDSATLRMLADMTEERCRAALDKAGLFRLLETMSVGNPD